MHCYLTEGRTFKCRRCLRCCEQPGFVYIREEEAERIAGFLGIEVPVFVNQYCDLWERRALVLKKKEDEKCFFLGDEGCLIYDARPDQCRDFPSKWKTERSLEYCDGMNGNRKGMISNRIKIRERI
ncbi:MAG TPA: YkgJ family cysteine cluster protein [Candidatus Omnitrophota bacterium]|nr:YkgJ family cysteine cluster protein [Candidatus Omnitrophota bacterium]